MISKQVTEKFLDFHTYFSLHVRVFGCLRNFNNTFCIDLSTKLILDLEAWYLTKCFVSISTLRGMIYITSGRFLWCCRFDFTCKISRDSFSIWFGKVNVVLVGRFWTSTSIFLLKLQEWTCFRSLSFDVF